MITSLRKPRVFVSSTVYDFSDLRSALKYWLEQLGYDVFLSEFNDFPNPPDVNSLEACLRALETADYYVLFIGSRVGTLYDVVEKISITRNEYRLAYKLFQEKKIKLLLFVRHDLWNLRLDRKALEKYLSDNERISKELDASLIASVVNHPSDFTNDAENIFSFIDEITRDEELKLATKGAGDFPKGNWVYSFDNFGEVIQALRIQLNVQDNIGRIALSINLKRELLTNLTQLLRKFDDSIGSLVGMSSRARTHLKGGYSDSSSIPFSDLKSLTLYLLLKPNSSRLSTLFIDEALASGHFLEFDLEENIFTAGVLVKRLIDLRSNIEQLRIVEGNVNFSAEYVKLEAYWKGGNSQRNIRVPNQTLLIPFAHADNVTNVIVLLRGILNALDGDTEALNNIELLPTSPIEEEANRIKSQQVTIEEAEYWLKNH